MADFGYIEWVNQLSTTDAGREALEKIQYLEDQVREQAYKIRDLNREIDMLQSLTTADEKKRIGYFFRSIEFQSRELFDTYQLDGYCDRMYEFRNWKGKDGKYKFRRAVSEVLDMPYMFLQPEYKVD